tara:strand:+ start:4542 stop:5348 length:807 start_codon:yes stop_codon:yes gene_type:complete
MGRISLLQAAEELALSEGQNVTFEEVLQLPFRSSDYRIHYGDDLSQFGGLWLSEGNNKGTVIFIHGGCWMKEYDIGHSHAFSSAMASAGYAVWSIEYRRTGDLGGGWPGTFMDVISGINKLNDLGEFDLNMERLVLMGHSAGGHLAILAGARSGLLDLKPSLVLGLAAITDVETYARGLNSCQESASEFMGGGPDELSDRYEEAQAVNYGVAPNTILLFGTKDQIVQSSQAILPGARSLRQEGAGHFDWIHPGTDAFSRILAVLLSEL